jgi:carbon monoxide dehydrogenase subunit G
MAQIEVSIEIPRTPEVVWADIARLETHVEWMADAESIEFEGESTSGVGTVMRVLTRIGPFRTTDVIRVVAWEPPHTLAVMHEGLVTGNGEFTLRRTPRGTRFIWSETLEMPLYLGGRLGALAAKPILSWVWRRNLRRLEARFS